MKPADLIEGIALADLAMTWAGVLSCLLIWKRLISSLKWLWGYLLSVGIIELTAKLYVYEWLEGSNLYLFHIYTVLEFALLAWMYNRIFSRRMSKALKVFLLLAFFSVATYSIAHLALNNWSPETFQTYHKLLVNGTLAGLALTFFIQSLKEPTRYLDHFHALGYANSGILLYFIGSFIIFLIMNQMVSSDLSKVMYLWIIHALLTFIFHLTCIIALWQKDSRLTKISPYG